ncbi:MAG: TlpA family protein disulfide reductase [Bacteroidales bacterium]|nr:TlpA family protein disulfide reductase [Bacteroidales bacterium]
MNHLRRHILLTFCLLTALAGQAQTPVTITGTATFAAGEEVRLLVFNDLLNGIADIAATDIIDKHGRFSLKYNTNDIQLAQLAIRTSKAEFFIVPANSYNFTVSMDSTLYQLINPEKYGGFLQIENDRHDTADLNYKINRFSEFFNRVSDSYSYPMIYGSEGNIFDTVRDIIAEQYDFQYVPTNFYQSYGFYTLGEIDLLQYRKKPIYIYQKYFDNDYILYNNPAYMSLFNQFYEGYLYYSPYISKETLDRTINENPDYPTLFNEVGHDPKLANARLRELVIIKNLIEFLDNEEFDRGNIIKLLDYIRQATSFEKHADLITSKLTTLKKNLTLPDELTFLNEKGRKVTLKQYEGKPVYLQVFGTDCISCIREMMIIKELHNKYQDKVQFVSLCVDMSKERYQDFVKRFGEQFDWPVLYFNEQYDWLLMNGVETLPDHLFFNGSGRLVMRYPPAPEHGLPEYMQINFSSEQEEDQNPLFYNRNKQ